MMSGGKALQRLKMNKIDEMDLRWPPSREELEWLYWSPSSPAYRSTYKLARLFQKSPTRIRQIMDELGIPRIRKAHRKKKAFENDRLEELYLCGYSEDLTVAEDSLGYLQVSLGTTHIASIKLFLELFEEYSTITATVYYSKAFAEEKYASILPPYYLRLTATLHKPSFIFLLRYKQNKKPFLEKILTAEERVAYTTGLIDAEGTITVMKNHCVRKKVKDKSVCRRIYYAPAIFIRINDLDILQWLKQSYGGSICEKTNEWKCSYRKARNLIQMINPRHEERGTRKEIILGYGCRNSEESKRAYELIRQYYRTVKRVSKSFRLFLANWYNFYGSHVDDIHSLLEEFQRFFDENEEKT